MNEVLNAIEQRRSVRGYEDRALTQEQIDALVKAALESPSARNAQPWHFSFVTDRRFWRRSMRKFSKTAA